MFAGLRGSITTCIRIGITRLAYLSVLPAVAPDAGCVFVAAGMPASGFFRPNTASMVVRARSPASTASTVPSRSRTSPGERYQPVDAPPKPPQCRRRPKSAFGSPSVRPIHHSATTANPRATSITTTVTPMRSPQSAMTTAVQFAHSLEADTAADAPEDAADPSAFAARAKFTNQKTSAARAVKSGRVSKCGFECGSSRGSTAAIPPASWPLEAVCQYRRAEAR